MTKKRSGGRVTPKGTQPTNQAHKAKPNGSSSGAPRSQPLRSDPTAARTASGPVGPTRSGHHRGNR